MLIRNRGIAPVLGLVLLFASCAQTTNTSTQETSAPLADNSSRVEMLASEMAGVGMERAFAWNCLDGGTLEDAWVSGSDLYLEQFNPAKRQYEVICVDLKVGERKWVVVLGPKKVRLDPRPGDRYVVFVTETDGGMIVVNRRTGAHEFRMRTELNVATTMPLASTDTTVFAAGLATNQILALNPVDARTAWRFAATSVITAGPIVTPRLPRGLAIVGGLDGEVVAVPAMGWNEVAPVDAAWRTRLLGACNALTMSDTVEAGKHSVSLIASCQDRGLYCLDGATGVSRWTYRTESPFVTAATVSGNVVFAHNADRLVAVDLTTGLSVWRASDVDKAPEGFELATEGLAYNAKRAYLRGHGHEVWRVDAKTGRTTAKATLGSFDWVMGAPEANLLLGLTKDGYVIAYK